ncbi:MAG: thioredoxin fold domain-containing protein [Coleofasciculaceae cyanobacterium SM2_1_6]|nr:thioredoxin fold domain-containing protein [Coleofasciculaceae cyanobacterium SM2_1_6]
MTNDTPNPTTPTPVPNTNLAPKLGTNFNPQKITNILIALAAIVLTVSLFFALRTPNNTSSLAAQAEAATPLEVALTNGKPTLMEFYADWCTSCQAMAGDLAELKEEYQEQMNFVMLNVDNGKWLPEMVTYKVDGIPLFVFLDQAGQAIAQSLGEQPRSILTAQLEALIAAQPLPESQPVGKVSELETALETTPVAQPQAKPQKVIDPRTHGS